jgi:hypothetical protein
MGPTRSFDWKLAVGGEWGCIPTLEVVMRPPEVFVRSLSHQEAVRLERLSTRAEYRSTRIRAAILLASNVRTPVPQIARISCGGCWPRPGHSFQHTRSWKASPDPDYETRAARVLQLYGAAARMRPPRAGRDVLGHSRTIRLLYPARQKLYPIQDNFSANWTPDIRQFAAANKIELVPTPTYASYLNRIESHFAYWECCK